MFKLTKILNGRINVPEPIIFPAGTSGVKAGEALIISGGKLVAATGANKPAYVSFADAEGGKDVSVYKVTPDMIFEVPVNYSAEAKDVVLGTKVTVSSDGCGVTDVTTSGVATVIDTLGANKTAGDKVLVIFE